MDNQTSDFERNTGLKPEIDLSKHIASVHEAVREAMIEHGPDGHVDGYDKITAAALKAAAPAIKAQALREAAAELLSDESAAPKSYKEMYNAIYAAWLQERADLIGGVE